jgi:hypothetical protein
MIPEKIFFSHGLPTRKYSQNFINRVVVVGQCQKKCSKVSRGAGKSPALTQKKQDGSLSSLK